MKAQPQVAHYCIVRADLPTRIKFAQFIHSSDESAVLRSDIPEGTYAIALQTKEGVTLEDISCRLIKAGIKHKRIFESDPPYDDGRIMSIGCCPMERSVIQPLLADLPSAKET